MPRSQQELTPDLLLIERKDVLYRRKASMRRFTGATCIVKQVRSLPLHRGTRRHRRQLTPYPEGYQRTDTCQPRPENSLPARDGVRKDGVRRRRSYAPISMACAYAALKEKLVELKTNGMNKDGGHGGLRSKSWWTFSAWANTGAWRKVY